MSVILPETAFISRFAIQVDDQVFVAFVKEKEDAWRLYQDAVTKGKTAGKSMEPSKKWISFMIKLIYLFMHFYHQLQNVNDKCVCRAKNLKVVRNICYRANHNWHLLRLNMGLLTKQFCAF